MLALPVGSANPRSVSTRAACPPSVGDLPQTKGKRLCKLLVAASLTAALALVRSHETCRVRVNNATVNCVHVSAELRASTTRLPLPAVANQRRSGLIAKTSYRARASPPCDPVALQV